eukprot:5415879-Pyramimonas_sp.AAC.1
MTLFYGSSKNGKGALNTPETLLKTESCIILESAPVQKHIRERMLLAFYSAAASGIRLVRRENIPVLPASDWAVVRILNIATTARHTSTDTPEKSAVVA